MPNSKLSRSLARLSVIVEENPCGWGDTVLSTLGESLDMLVSERTKAGVTLMELADYYHVSVRTIQRWRNDFNDFPSPIDPYAKTLSFPVDDVVEWKHAHPFLF